MFSKTKQNVHQLFYDFSKAYDFILQYRIYEILSHQLILSKHIRLVNHVYKGQPWVWSGIVFWKSSVSVKKSPTDIFLFFVLALEPHFLGVRLLWLKDIHWFRARKIASRVRWYLAYRRNRETESAIFISWLRQVRGELLLIEERK